MSKKKNKLFQGILDGLIGAGYKQIGLWLLKGLFFGGLCLYQHMVNTENRRELRLQSGETMKSVIVNYEQNAQKMLDYLKEYCDKGIYIGYFAPTNVNLYHWIYLVSNNELLTQGAQDIVKNPEPFLKIIPPFYQDAIANILQVAKLQHGTSLLSQKDYNPPLYHTEYNYNDFDANTLAYFKSSPKQIPVKVTKDMKNDLKLVKNTFANLQLNQYTINEGDITAYIYKIDGNVHFISILFAKKDNKCENKDKLQKLANSMYKIIKD